MTAFKKFKYSVIITQKARTKTIETRRKFIGAKTDEMKLLTLSQYQNKVTTRSCKTDSSSLWSNFQWAFLNYAGIFLALL